MFAEGLSQQKGNIFGFGQNVADDTKTVLKISQASPGTMVKLDQFFAVHSIDEEQNVGSFNYACTIKPSFKYLHSASRKVALKSSFDVLDKCNPVEFWK